jgi:hypothetical protein
MSAFLTSLYFFGMNMTVAIDCDGIHDRQCRAGLVHESHAVRNAVRLVHMDDDLVMLIGPASDGALLEIGVLDSMGTTPSSSTQTPCDAGSTSSLDEVPMTRHTDKEIAQAGGRFERLADALDPETTKVEDTDDLRAIAIAAETVRTDDAHLQEAVLLARAHGRSWNHIALALGVSRQAARQRFASKASA